MRKKFTEAEADILIQVAKEVEEFHCDMRHGVEQTKYVFEVKLGTIPWNGFDSPPDQKIPADLVGFWVMDYSDDLSYRTISEAIRKYPWVKCVKEPVTTYEWKEIRT